MSRRRKRRSLGTILKEGRLAKRFAHNRWAAEWDYDWDQIRYNRVAIVNLLLADRPNGRYLEIGCADNVLFDAVMAADKTGVDPARGGTHRMTSDAFFAAGVEAPFDVIFIDGLHLYPQVRRDLVNALAHLRPGGWIAMHDMLPRDWLEEHVPQIRTSGWTGDGWKTAFELAASSDIDFRLIAIDFGVAVARPRIAGAGLADLGATLADKRFKYLHENIARLPLVGYETGRAWIESQRSVRAHG
jgi:hypothetical protein